MADNRGGAREGAGRKPKAEEEKSKRLSAQGLIAEFGSEEEAWQFAAKEAKAGGKTGLGYLKLLIEYAYGKPTQTIDNNISLPKPARKYFKDFGDQH